MARHSFAGSPALTFLTGSINSTDLTLAVDSTAGWPDTAIGEFVIVVDAEKMLCSAYTSTSVTVDTRGYDDTPNVGHDPGATGQVFPCLDATQFDLHDEFVAKNATVTASTSAVGDAATTGSSQWSAAADHKHGREAFASGATTASAPGDAGANGTSASPARADHRHSRESYATLASNLAPLLPATLTTHAGNLNSDYPVTGSLTDFMDTATLATGTWAITMGATVVGTGAGNVEIQAVAGAGTTATFLGRTSAEVTPGGDDDLTLTFTAAVTVTGPISFKARGATTGGSLTIKATTPTSSLSNATGYMAMKTA